MVNIAFIHPDLGIGGAERLICDAALSLQSRGHTVKIFTSHHDRNHCFSETTNGTLQVKAVADWLPRSTFKHFYAFWAYIRMIVVAIYLLCFSDFIPDIIVCDQVSACIPVLKLKKKKVVFYCHFPDMLLTKRQSLLKYIYRLPLDSIEEFTTGLADIILVNSKFTAGIFKETFKTLCNNTEPIVLYPTLNFESFSTKGVDKNELLKDLIPTSAEFIFLSINRFERKKNLSLAIKAFKELANNCNQVSWKKCHLIIAGGYDDRVIENKEHYLELVQLTEKLEIINKVTFMRSFSDKQKLALLDLATCLLYTPSNEHFGIVPIESMYMECPVVACASGGPLETVQHGMTGFLCEPEPSDFAHSMSLFVTNISLRNGMGKRGHERVVKHFSFGAFTENLDKLVKGLHVTDARDVGVFKNKLVFMLVGVCIMIIATIYVIITNLIN